MESPVEGDKNYLAVYDYIAVSVYYLTVFFVGLYSTCRPRRNTLNGYFLAGRFMTWLPVGASLFASNIGSEHFIGLAGSGAAAGIAVGAFELNALILLQVLGWIFLPVFIASGVCTLPEYMRKRFGGQRIRIYLAVMSLILYIFTKISVNIYSGSLFIQQALGWNIWYSIVLILLLTYICSAMGGLAAVIYMDTLQFFIIIAGSLLVTVTGFIKVGGWSALVHRYLQAVPNDTYPNTTCGVPRADSWVMLRDPFDSDMPWPAFLLGQTPASIWYWCADQMMVQRTLAAKSLSHAQGGTLLAGYAKTLPLFLMVLPGMISRVLYTDEVACVRPETCMAVCGSPTSCSNSAYPRLVLGTMPAGLRGVMLAVMLAALMSDLSSVFNSASTLFTMDVWKRVRTRANTKELLLVSKVFTAGLVLISLLWIPVIQKTQGGQLFIYIQSVAAYFAPPIAAIYCLAIVCPRANEQGAVSGLLAGVVLGLVRMGVDVAYPEPPCYEADTRLAIFKLHYMYFAVLLFWFTIFLAVAVSLLTAPPPEHMLIRTTYWTRFDKRKRQDEERQATEQHELVTKCDVVAHIKQDIKQVPVKDPEKQQPTDEGEKLGWKRHIRNFVYCVETDSEKVLRVLRETQEASIPLPNLDQTSTEKWILNSCLVLIVGLAVALYAFFTISPLPQEEIDRLRFEAYDRVVHNLTG